MRNIMLAACLLFFTAAAGAADFITYPRSPAFKDPRHQFCYTLLQAVLKKSGQDVQARLSALEMHQARAIQLMEKGDGVDIGCFMTSAEREARMLPIRIPVDRGLIGVRLMLIHKSQAARWASFSRADQLRSLTAGQGKDWPDTAILRANGFTVYERSDWEVLFKMLLRDNLDYFPRAVSEVWQEADAFAPRLIVAPGLALQYDTAAYFFVRKGNTQLAATVTTGLQAMIADGSFERMFDQYYGASIARANLKSRKLIKLNNPMLPGGIPRDQRHLLLFGQ